MLRFLTTFDFTLENILQFVVYSAIFGAMVFFTARSLKSAPVDSEGWQWVRPSFMHHFAVVGSLLFSLLMWWLYFFVGSARADAEYQETGMLLLALAFGLGALVVWWLFYANRICWRDDRIRLWTLRRFTEYSFDEIVEIKQANGEGNWRITFEDGRSATVSEMSHGFDDLGDHLEEYMV
ncbi:MAG: hypothetical protein QNI87_05005 [Erythrobacter sp.]|uniref:hypothetical protein n=1 Tax=Erythrobacter sp. TaxID=1042 RepID=UPI00261BAB2F|nr:hypothetical protein [Erythrobacter sp.]MDJ0977875.1 hypothetical protein [Erythrobacter sp.]